MLSFNLSSPSNCNTADAEEILERFDPYIVAQVEKLALCHSWLMHSTLLHLEIDEIIQNVRIKFWRVLTDKQILYPRAYIQQIIHNEFNDIGRRRKPSLLLSIDEATEVNQGKVMINLSEGMDDPASEFEQKEGVANCIAVVAEAVVKLPPRQKLAMICLLLERVDDVAQFVEALNAYRVNVGMMQWPSDRVDAQRLKASISSARLKIVQHIAANTSSLAGKASTCHKLPQRGGKHNSFCMQKKTESSVQ